MKKYNSLPSRWMSFLLSVVFLVTEMGMAAGLAVAGGMNQEYRTQNQAALAYPLLSSQTQSGDQLFNDMVEAVQVEMGHSFPPAIQQELTDLWSSSESIVRTPDELLALIKKKLITLTDQVVRTLVGPKVQGLMRMALFECLCATVDELLWRRGIESKPDYSRKDFQRDRLEYFRALTEACDGESRWCKDYTLLTEYFSLHLSGDRSLGVGTLLAARRGSFLASPTDDVPYEVILRGVVQDYPRSILRGDVFGEVVKPAAWQLAKPTLQLFRSRYNGQKELVDQVPLEKFSREERRKLDQICGDAIKIIRNHVQVLHKSEEPLGDSDRTDLAILQKMLVRLEKNDLPPVYWFSDYSLPGYSDKKVMCFDRKCLMKKTGPELRAPYYPAEYFIDQLLCVVRDEIEGLIPEGIPAPIYMAGCREDFNRRVLAFLAKETTLRSADEFIRFVTMANPVKLSQGEESLFRYNWTSGCGAQEFWVFEGFVVRYGGVGYSIRDWLEEAFIAIEKRRSKNPQLQKNGVGTNREVDLNVVLDSGVAGYNEEKRNIKLRVGSYGKNGKQTVPLVQEDGFLVPVDQSVGFAEFLQDMNFPKLIKSISQNGVVKEQMVKAVLFLFYTAISQVNPIERRIRNVFICERTSAEDLICVWNYFVEGNGRLTKKTRSQIENQIRAITASEAFDKRINAHSVFRYLTHLKVDGILDRSNVLDMSNPSAVLHDLCEIPLSKVRAAHAWLEECNYIIEVACKYGMKIKPVPIAFRAIAALVADKQTVIENVFGQCFADQDFDISPAMLVQFWEEKMQHRWLAVRMRFSHVFEEIFRLRIDQAILLREWMTAVADFGFEDAIRTRVPGIGLRLSIGFLWSCLPKKDISLDKMMATERKALDFWWQQMQESAGGSDQAEVQRIREQAITYHLQKRYAQSSSPVVKWVEGMLLRVLKISRYLRIFQGNVPVILEEATAYVEECFARCRKFPKVEMIHLGGRNIFYSWLNPYPRVVGIVSLLQHIKRSLLSFLRFNGQTGMTRLLRAVVQQQAKGKAAEYSIPRIYPERVLDPEGKVGFTESQEILEKILGPMKNYYGESLWDVVCGKTKPWLINMQWSVIWAVYAVQREGMVVDGECLRAFVLKYMEYTTGSNISYFLQQKGIPKSPKGFVDFCLSESVNYEDMWRLWERAQSAHPGLQEAIDAFISDLRAKGDDGEYFLKLFYGVTLLLQEIAPALLAGDDIDWMSSVFKDRLSSCGKIVAITEPLDLSKHALTYPRVALYLFFWRSRQGREFIRVLRSRILAAVPEKAQKTGWDHGLVVRAVQPKDIISSLNSKLASIVSGQEMLSKDDIVALNWLLERGKFESDIVNVLKGLEIPSKETSRLLHEFSSILMMLRTRGDVPHFRLSHLSQQELLQFVQFWWAKKHMKVSVEILDIVKKAGLMKQPIGQKTVIPLQMFLFQEVMRQKKCKRLQVLGRLKGVIDKHRDAKKQLGKILSKDIKEKKDPSGLLVYMRDYVSELIGLAPTAESSA